MAIGDALVAPTGVQNQMYGQPSRVPGYSEGLSQAPGQMALPPEPYPIGRPTGVVGGPAYFTPAGYEAPPQPTQAFMPTDVRPDPIGQQFMRQYESPMGQQFIDQYEATQAPIREAEAAARAEAQAAQDARFQELMDRIAELEGQLATPTEPIPDVPFPTDPYIPGQTPFPGIPDYLRDLDFSGLPDVDLDGILPIDFGDMDLGDLQPIFDEYQQRIDMGEPEPLDTFLPNMAGHATSAPAPAPQYDVSTDSMPDPVQSYIDVDGNLQFGDLPIEPFFEEQATPEINFYKDLPGQFDFTGLSGDIDIPPSTTTGPLTGTFGNFGPFMPEIPIPESVKPGSLGGVMEFSEARERAIKTGTKMPNIEDYDLSAIGPLGPPPPLPTPPPVRSLSSLGPLPNEGMIIDFSNLPNFNPPTTGGRSMIPDFGNFDLR